MIYHEDDGNPNFSRLQPRSIILAQQKQLNDSGLLSNFEVSRSRTNHGILELTWSWKSPESVANHFHSASIYQFDGLEKRTITFRDPTVKGFRVASIHPSDSYYICIHVTYNLLPNIAESPLTELEMRQTNVSAISSSDSVAILTNYSQTTSKYSTEIHCRVGTTGYVHFSAILSIGIGVLVAVTLCLGLFLMIRRSSGSMRHKKVSDSFAPAQTSRRPSHNKSSKISQKRDGNLQARIPRSDSGEELSRQLTHSKTVIESSLKASYSKSFEDKHLLSPPHNEIRTDSQSDQPKGNGRKSELTPRRNVSFSFSNEVTTESRTMDNDTKIPRQNELTITDDSQSNDQIIKELIGFESTSVEVMVNPQCSEIQDSSSKLSSNDSECQQNAPHIVDVIAETQSLLSGDSEAFMVPSAVDSQSSPREVKESSSTKEPVSNFFTQLIETL